DPDGRFLEVNPALRRMLGYASSELGTLTLGSIIHPEDREAQERLYGAVRDGQPHEPQVELRLRRKSGKPFWACLGVSFVGDAGTQPIHVTLVEDISERRRKEKYLQYQALHDQVTGLPNRMSLQ